MSQDIGKTVATSIAGLDEMNATIGSGATLVCYDGVKDPITGGAPTDTVGATFNLNNPAFNAAGDDTTRASATINGTLQATTAQATVTWWRIYKSDGTTVVYDGDISEQGTPPQGSLEFDDVNFQTSGTATISSFTIYLDNA